MGELLQLSDWPFWGNGLLLAASIAVIALGAHWMVESASRVAARLGVSELVIGLTVVALGTSAPEFAVTVLSALQGRGDISVSNIVGSNIFNLGFILGGCAMVAALPVRPRLLKRDGAVLVASTVLLLVLVGPDLSLGHLDGTLLFASLVLYMVFLFRQRRLMDPGDEESGVEASAHLPRDLALLALSLAAIVGGSNLLVDASVAMARAFGVSEWAIGVTVVAAGTSMPELAASLAAMLKGRYAISAGNIIGSNIFNLLGVLGAAGILRPVEISPVARVSLVVLSALVLLSVLLMRTGWRLSRIEGTFLVIVAALVWVSDFLMHAAH